ncbi:phage replisome organizer N-terminal domain-containing protein [Enterococcus cecorum]|uniref:phage replisome organizer N-terminal domain-containing protein n=1 Tax=Enterococcus cecorum TaxID=44008 RepID=UPI001FAB7FFD|nr:phage replisome organizer N-terminal domain-containing protein [Enterococcus cecorum]MCJ0536156.1 phage replisome organizer N-terminal domain-containing protein [Enterococcus cecorum]MCJ0555164.1 phage replisome organizer N-terminal domain-containing protein [Enterococcus cecorum]
MADNKKYYYLKLADNFFNRQEIVFIEEMKDGDKYIVVLLKLYLLSLKDNGRLSFKKLVPYDTKMLATITKKSERFIKKAINLFEKYELIEVLDTGIIYMNDIQSFIGKSSTEADRKREQRKRAKAEKEQNAKNTSDENMGHLSDICPPNVHERIENRDKRIENRELQQETDKNQKGLSLSSLFEFWESNGFGMLAPKTRQDLAYWVKDFQELGANEQEALELIQEALNLAINANARRYNYVNGILKNWEAKRYTNVKQVNADRKASAGIRKDMTDRQREDAEKVEREAMENPNSIYNAF